MKKLKLLLAINLFFLINTYSINNKQDSIYADLYSFLVSRGDIKKEQVPEFDSSGYRSYIYISDILKDDSLNKPDLTVPFGIYKFKYNGCTNKNYYVLIKNQESYNVYKLSSLVIKELIENKIKTPKLIDNELFYAYLEKIADDILNLFVNQEVTIQKMGNIEYYFSLE